jgi:hypothetical protein
MFDPNFDPLQELDDCKVGLIRHTHDIRTLVNAHNNQQGLLNDLVNQHRDLIRIIRQAQGEIRGLRAEVEHLKGMIPKKE